MDKGTAKNTDNWGDILKILYLKKILGKIITNGMDKTICLINSSLVASSSLPETCINVITAYNNPKNGNPTTTIFIMGIVTFNKSISLVKILRTSAVNINTINVTVIE